MVRITRVYTRKGDKGKTSLVGKARLSKDSMRISALGTIDELNSYIGLVICVIPSKLDLIHEQLIRIQNELFELGAQLSVINTGRQQLHINKTDVEKLEQEIDAMNNVLPTLQSFVLPGGVELAARLQFCRTICRRAERATVALAEQENLPGHEIMYLNRLSDWLFVAARFVNFQLNHHETLWVPRNKPSQ